MLSTFSTVFSCKLFSDTVILLITVAVYLLPLLVCFTKLRDKPFLRMRSPYLVLISACAMSV